MQTSSQRKRAGKRLLVAAIGVATVSFVGAQSGCAPDTDDLDARDETSAPYDDEGAAPSVSDQSLTSSAARLKLPQSGNLLPPPGIDPGTVVLPPKGFPPSGNLMAPPGNYEPPIVVGPVLPPSGNLMPPIQIKLEAAELEQLHDVEVIAP
jgi:hypothetical protein